MTAMIGALSQQSLRPRVHCCGVTALSRARPFLLRTRTAAARLTHEAQQQRLPRHTCNCAAAATAESPAAAPSTDVRVELEELTATRRRITVTAPPRLCKQAWQRTLKKTRSRKDIPGFRSLKTVSEAHLLQFMGGRLGAQAAAVELLIQMLPEETLQLTTDAISTSVAPEGLTDETVAAFDASKPFTYQIGYDIQPTLKWKEPYKGLKIEVVATGDESTDERAMQQEVRQIRKKKGNLRVVQNQTFQLGDVAIVDFDARRADTGQAFPGAKRVKTQLDSDSADMQYLPGVAEGMVGMNVGDSRELEIDLPDDFEPAALRGVRVICHVVVSEIFQYDLAELDDAVAEEVAPGCGGAAGLQAQLLRKHQAATAQANQQAVQQALMQAMCDVVDCPVPGSMVKEMGEQEYQARLLEAQARGQISFEQVQQLATPEGLEGYIKTKYTDLEDMVRCQMACEAISQAEGLEITPEEFQDEYQVACGQFQEQQQEYDDAKLREQVNENLKAAKIMQWLAQNSDIVMLPPATSVSTGTK